MTRVAKNEQVEETRRLAVSEVDVIVRACGQLARLGSELHAIERSAGRDRSADSDSVQRGCEGSLSSSESSSMSGRSLARGGAVAESAFTEPLLDRLQRAQRAAAKASVAARRLAAQLLPSRATDGDRDATNVVVSPGHEVWRVATGQQHRAIERLVRSGVDYDFAESSVRESAAKRVVTAADARAAVKRLVVASDALASALAGSLAAEVKAPVSAQADEGPAAVATSASALILEAGAAAVLVLGNFVSWFDALSELFNDSDDDRARDLINGSGCAALRAMSTRQHFDLIDAMVRGPTGDDDELAILRLLDCLTCSQVRDVVSRFGFRGTELIDEFQGVEFDRLMIRLQECGVVSFSDWDDDTTRRFVQFASCESLRRLSLNQIRQLLRNLFSGHTGDDDERAILKLIRCQSCARRRALVRMSGLSVDDFDDEVDGAEWRELRRLLQQCGIAA